MGRETEKMLHQLQKFIDAHESEVEDEQDVDDLVQLFMVEYNKGMRLGKVVTVPETSEDYLDLAENASSKKKKKEYLQRSLELDEDNLDAARLLADMEAKSREDFLIRLHPLIERGNALMEDGGFFRDCMGSFWGEEKTRPYMRLRFQYMHTLTDCGMRRKAAREGEELLELSDGDSLGVHYDLVHLYAALEDEDAATLLYSEYGGAQDTQMLLPLAVLYYKLEDFEKSLAILRQLYKVNKDTKKFIRAVINNTVEDYEDQLHPYYFKPNTISDLLFTYMSYYYLYDSVGTFFEWAQQNLKGK